MDSNPKRSKILQTSEAPEQRTTNMVVKLDKLLCFIYIYIYTKCQLCAAICVSF